MMKKCVRRLLCAGITLLVTTSFFVTDKVSATSSAGNLDLAIEFTEASYIAGETAVADIYITGGAEEVDNNLAVVDLRIQYDSDTMTFNGGEFNSAFPQADGECTKQIKLSTNTNETDVVSVMYIKANNNSAAPTFKVLAGDKGEALNDTDKIRIASLKFKINKSAAADFLNIKFRKYYTTGDTTNRYPGCLMNDNNDRYTLNINYDEIYKANLSNQKAKIKNTGYSLYNSTYITTEPEVFVNNTDGAILIVKFYDNRTGFLTAPVVVKELGDGENKFSDENAIKVNVFENCDQYNLVAKYYVWNSLTLPKPLCDAIVL